MRKACVSTTFTVYFDGQFWVGVAERVEGDALSAARVVFGAEPSDEEIFQFVLRRWGELRFSSQVPCRRRTGRLGNPKRRQREAAREVAQAAPSTRAQRALAAMREQGKAEAHGRRAQARREKAAERYALRRERRRRKRRGR